MSVEYCHQCNIDVDTDLSAEHFTDHEEEVDAEVEKTNTFRDLQAPNWPLTN